mmetsp:Transcript_27781/g.70154  ORF Transcript_27781/g.70154 Transcript_27781/m.70154 type:complete len:966 (+) Transcript_27781:104-3001(+)|eukprot:CAMPEP_0178992638 /NCGR_PEP_ID=MMETSP0795-20121207/6231_1 /TAXON_ID=88552 /ORGANISM="Amoebophrya sp., Strain Ameob2" /LENGTH=965 /DNA_ID=CAMNT_0020684553 /DNA_START=99 /DNA_END=2996 /DNA_ORIENTATION=-
MMKSVSHGKRTSSTVEDKERQRLYDKHVKKITSVKSRIVSQWSDREVQKLQPSLRNAKREQQISDHHSAIERENFRLLQRFMEIDNGKAAWRGGTRNKGSGGPGSVSVARRQELERIERENQGLLKRITTQKSAIVAKKKLDAEHERQQKIMRLRCCEHGKYRAGAEGAGAGLPPGGAPVQTRRGGAGGARAADGHCDSHSQGESDYEADFEQEEPDILDADEMERVRIDQPIDRLIDRNNKLYGFDGNEGDVDENNLHDTSEDHGADPVLNDHTSPRLHEVDSDKNDISMSTDENPSQLLGGSVVTDANDSNIQDQSAGEAEAATTVKEEEQPVEPPGEEAVAADYAELEKKGQDLVQQLNRAELEQALAELAEEFGGNMVAKLKHVQKLAAPREKIDTGLGNVGGQQADAVQGGAPRRGVHGPPARGRANSRTQSKTTAAAAPVKPGDRKAAAAYGTVSAVIKSAAEQARKPGDVPARGDKQSPAAVAEQRAAAKSKMEKPETTVFVPPGFGRSAQLVKHKKAELTYGKRAPAPARPAEEILEEAIQKHAMKKQLDMANGAFKPTQNELVTREDVRGAADSEWGKNVLKNHEIERTTLTRKFDLQKDQDPSKKKQFRAMAVGDMEAFLQKNSRKRQSKGTGEEEMLEGAEHQHRPPVDADSLVPQEVSTAAGMGIKMPALETEEDVQRAADWFLHKGQADMRADLLERKTVGEAVQNQLSVLTQRTVAQVGGGITGIEESGSERHAVGDENGTTQERDLQSILRSMRAQGVPIADKFEDSLGAAQGAVPQTSTVREYEEQEENPHYSDEEFQPEESLLQSQPPEGTHMLSKFLTETETLAQAADPVLPAAVADSPQKYGYRPAYDLPAVDHVPETFNANPSDTFQLSSTTLAESAKPAAPKSLAQSAAGVTSSDPAARARALLADPGLLSDEAFQVPKVRALDMAADIENKIKEAEALLATGA